MVQPIWNPSFNVLTKVFLLLISFLSSSGAGHEIWSVGICSIIPEAPFTPDLACLINSGTPVIPNLASKSNTVGKTFDFRFETVSFNLFWTAPPIFLLSIFNLSTSSVDNWEVVILSPSILLTLGSNPIIPISDFIFPFPVYGVTVLVV